PFTAAAETATPSFFSRRRVRFGLAPLLVATFAVSSARWALVATVPEPWLLVALQLAHALTFGAFWGSALSWVGECVPPRLRATGQTLFTGVLYGFGNGLGMLASGALYDAFHGAEAAFLAAAALELVPLALMISWGRRLDPLRA